MSKKVWGESKMDPSFVKSFCCVDWKKQRRAFFRHLEAVLCDATPSDLQSITADLQTVCNTLMAMDYNKKRPNDDRNFVSECRRYIRKTFEGRVPDFETMNIKLQRILKDNNHMRKERETRQEAAKVRREVTSTFITNAVEKLKRTNTLYSRYALLQLAMGCRYKEVTSAHVEVDGHMLGITNHSKQIGVKARAARYMDKQNMTLEEAMDAAEKYNARVIHRPCLWFLFDDMTQFLEMRMAVIQEAAMIPRQKLYKGVHRTIKRCFGKGWGTHDLRRLYASYAHYKFEPTTNVIEYAKRVLGHKSLDTSVLYTHIHIL
jgi:integrase